MSATIAVTTRVYTDDDEAAVLRLLDRSLGAGPSGTRSRHFFAWKHLDNPFGRSMMLVAEAEGRIIGFRSLMRWRFVSAAGEVRAVRAVDTATDPDHQGRGIFSRLTLEALPLLEADTDTVFNTPNEKSWPGYRKMGWEQVGHVRVHARVRRPVRVLRNARRPGTAGLRPAPAVEAAPVGDVMAGIDGDALQPTFPPGRLHTAWAPGFLRWRYVDAPGLDYRAVGDADTGMAIFRVRPRGSVWESTVAEVLPLPGRRGAARDLLRRVVRASAVDQVTCHLTPDTSLPGAARARGFLPVPGGIRLVARPLRSGIVPDPRELASWRVSLGDLEVF